MAVERDKIGKVMARKIMQYYFMPFQGNTFFAELDSLITKAPKEIQPIALAFRHNIESVLSTVSVPATLAMAGAQHSRFQQLHIAEKIRARNHLGPDGEPTAEALQAALEMARKRMNEEITSREGLDHLADSTSSFLLGIHEDESIKQAAAELLRQGVVLIWGAFEVLARDLFVAYVNANPSCSEKIAGDPTTKRLFELKGLSLDVLSDHGYDVSRSMGNILASLNDVSNLPAIRDVFQVVFPESTKLREKLHSKDIWLLAQRRHLIVHQRGVVDEKYLRNSGDDIPVGHTLDSTQNKRLCFCVDSVGGHDENCAGWSRYTWLSLTNPPRDFGTRLW